MTDVSDILLKQMELDRALGLHEQNQRSTMTNLVIVVDAVAFGFLAERGLSNQSLAVTIPLVFLGLYGALSATKFYERWQAHAVRSRALQLRLDELLPDLRLVLTEEQPRHSTMRTIR
jgi:hypothetical protein